MNYIGGGNVHRMIWEEKIHIALYYRRKFIHKYIGGEHIFVILRTQLF